MKKDFSYGVIPIIKNGPEPMFLLVHLAGKGGYWGFPKGHKDPGESDLETARRELMEETGISEIEILPNKTIIDRYTMINQDGVSFDKTVTFYIGLLSVKPELKLQPEEVDDAKWLTFDDAIKLVEFETLRDVLRKTKAVLDQRSSI